MPTGLESLRFHFLDQIEAQVSLFHRLFPFSEVRARLLCLECIDHPNPQVRDESARGLSPFVLNSTGGLGPDLLPDPKTPWPKFDGTSIYIRPCDFGIHFLLDWMVCVKEKVAKLLGQTVSGNVIETNTSPNLSLPSTMYKRLLEFTRKVLEEVDTALHLNFVAGEGVGANEDPMVKYLMKGDGDEVRMSGAVSFLISLLWECINPSKVKLIQLHFVARFGLKSGRSFIGRASGSDDLRF